MIQAYFIDEDFLKNTTPINRNVDPTLLKPIIYMAQEKYIVDLLGRALATRLQEGFINSDWTAKEEELLYFVQFALAWWSYHDSILRIRDRVVNIGTVNQRDAVAGQSVSEEWAIAAAMKNAKSEADYWMKRAYKFICNNASDFPTYSVSQDDQMPAGRPNSSYNPISILSDRRSVDPEFLRRYFEGGI